MRWSPCALLKLARSRSSWPVVTPSGSSRWGRAKVSRDRQQWPWSKASSDLIRTLFPGDRPVQEVKAVHGERGYLTLAQPKHGSKPDHGAVAAEPVRHRGQLVDLEGGAVHQLSGR
jgi:hypothetical protein